MAWCWFEKLCFSPFKTAHILAFRRHYLWGTLCYTQSRCSNNLFCIVIFMFCTKESCVEVKFVTRSYEILRPVMEIHLQFCFWQTDDGTEPADYSSLVLLVPILEMSNGTIQQFEITPRYILEILGPHEYSIGARGWRCICISIKPRVIIVALPL